MHTVVDLFAGCGGGSMGFAKAGFKILAAVELDPDAAASYALNTGVSPMVKDVREVAAADLEVHEVRCGELTLLFGCPPCQSFTVLRRAAEASEDDLHRNALIFEYLRLVEDLRPRHIAFENVPGLMEGRWRAYFDVFRDRLTDLGYTIAWRVVDAADYGVPQRRRRVLVIGSRTSVPSVPDPTHAPVETDDLRGYVTVRDALSHLPPVRSGEVDPADPFHRSRNHSELTLQRLAAVPEGGGRADLPEHLVLRCHREHGGHFDVYGRMWWDRVAPTLTSGCTNVTKGRFGHPDQARALTAREAMLLQTFPHDARLSGGADSMALQVGNAIPSLLAQRIAEKIIEMDRVAIAAAR
jgi:DNA (cytosine-5)-methyltransferase 1